MMNSISSFHKQYTLTECHHIMQCNVYITVPNAASAFSPLLHMIGEPLIWPLHHSE